MTTTTPVAPSAPAAGAGNASRSRSVLPAAQTKEMFLKILVAQMRNQDPMNPSSPEQMASQLAQFSSLEQLVSINERLGAQGSGNEDLLAAIQAANEGLLSAIQSGAALNALGRTVVARGDGVTVADGVAPQVRVSAADAASKSRITILDREGKEVASAELGALRSGEQTIDIGEATKGLPAGTYRYRIDAAAKDGTAVAVQTWSAVKVDAVSRDAKGPVFRAGWFTISFADVTEVR